MLLEIGRGQIEGAQRNQLVAAEPGLAELVLELRGVADHHHRQSIGLHVQPRHAEYVVWGDGQVVD